MKLFALTLLLILLSVPVWSAKQILLVENGNAKSVILIPSNPHEDEKLAAKELVDHIEKMSGCRIDVVQEIPGKGWDINPALNKKGLCYVFLGTSGMTQEMEKAIRFSGNDPASFMIKAEANPQAVNYIRIAGLSPEGTLFGIYELLEQIGVRWYIPGDLGTVIPEKKTVAVSEQATIQVPSFGARHLQMTADKTWYRRMRLGGPYFPSAHGINIGKADINKEPDLFALVDGKRQQSQLCISNPEVLKRAIAETKNYFRKNPSAIWIGMGPNDGGGFCECENCRALDAGDFDSFEHMVSMTDRYIWFFNKVLEGIQDEFPDKKIGFYCYSAYMKPPVKVKPDPRIVLAFAPINLCRIHGMSNPVCPERSYYKKIMEAWGKLLPETYERGYFFNLADPGFPFSKVHAIRDEIPVAKEFGIKGWRVETFPHWASMTPTIYIATKLFWNHKADVDALIRDFAVNFFGPASGEMEKYIILMDRALRDADFHTGCSYDLPFIYNPSVMQTGQQYLKKAEALVKNTKYAERVAIFRLSYDYLASFLSMLENRNRFDFLAAKKDLENLQEIQKKAFQYEPKMFYEKAATSYMKRFFSPCIEQGYERTTGKNVFIAGLPDEMDFQIDPAGVGEDLGYFRAGKIGGNWLKIKTKTLSWSDQGLRYYKGDAWYRSSVMIPEKFKGKKIFIWFGGVDELAKVWINGNLVGTSHGRAFVPFEFEITDFVQFGKENFIAVKITNEKLNELGTGGITAPVMLYAQEN
ncbi:MAG: DUF4838 domain-containing protein [Candidatus Omnitrophica bacterium]|nr:DUF4838 domain-containing protein [Candidatus Omnitrophota bacterium]